MPKISVIMPSLNVCKYIKECMDSVVNQTMRDIEIIVVDAGSTDGTLAILEEYAQKDKRVKVFNSVKRSYGYQVNMGMFLATGDYIGIVETDDVIVPDMYETLYEVCVENDADFVKGYTKPFYTLGKEERFFSTSNTFFIKEGIANQVINPSERPDIFLKDRFVWLGLYKSKLAKTVKLNETSGAAFQDVGFMFQTLSQSKRAVYIDKPIHFYRQDNSNSSIHNPKSVSYIVNEYSLDRCYLQGKDIGWYTAFYTRMFDQINSRFDVMAKGECFWDDAILDIDIIRKQLYEAVKAGYLSEKTMGDERWRKLQLFFRDRESIYVEYLQKYRPIKREYKNLLEKIDNNPVIIFGAGRYGKFLNNLLQKHGKKVVAFCDNNLEIQHTKINGRPVLSPEAAIMDYDEAVFVIASAKHSEDIKLQLIQNKVSVERIGIYMLGINMLLLTI